MRVTEPHSTSNRGSCLESRAWRENNNFLYQLVLNIYTYHNYYNYRYLLLTLGANGDIKVLKQHKDSPKIWEPHPKSKNNTKIHTYNQDLQKLTKMY